ncbi:MAG: type II toxin-antitoxin system Phd/YefM family antitoxin [Fibrobacteres bacterium]|nr:type II toxin-antitoxin system Phd/YefM family antitoxin [Fibrobacterota bacterium]
MQMTWQLQEAKNKFCEVVENALKNGAQEITRRGKKTAVVLSFEDYKAMKVRKGSLADFFKASPLSGMNFERNKDLPREVEL